jgi:hypothetical protein
VEEPLVGGAGPAAVVVVVVVVGDAVVGDAVVGAVVQVVGVAVGVTVAAVVAVEVAGRVPLTFCRLGFGRVGVRRGARAGIPTRRSSLVPVEQMVHVLGYR